MAEYEVRLLECQGERSLPSRSMASFRAPTENEFERGEQAENRKQIAPELETRISTVRGV
jgi:hypothetical protein